MSFRGCTALKKVVFRGTPENIEAYAFADCPSLRSVTLPKRVGYVEDGAFGEDTEIRREYRRPDLRKWQRDLGVQ